MSPVQYVFDPEALAALRAFVGPDTLIALDYDGTLAPIVATPEHAAMPRETRARLGRVARRHAVVVLTGRARSDAMRMLSGIPVLEIIGSHGVETEAAVGRRFLARVADWRARLAERLGTLAGVRIEDKRYSLSVHYRQTPDPAGAREIIGRAVGDLEGARIIGGKKVVNVLPQEAPDKGVALVSACRRLGCGRAIYVGDDETDEPAFAAAAGGPFFTIRVGKDPASSARYYLRAQKEIDRLLQLFLEPGPSGRPAPPG